MEKNPAVSANDTQDAVSKNNATDIAALQSDQDDDPIYISAQSDLTQQDSISPRPDNNSAGRSKARSKRKAQQALAWEMSATDALKVNYLSRNKSDSLEPF